MENLTEKTLELLKQAQQQNIGPALAKAGITTATGIVGYDLEPAAKLLYPVLTPLRNRIPRRATGAMGQQVGIATHWKQITDINAGAIRAGVSEGNRGGVISYTEADKLATYKGMGLENSVSFEAEYAARGFDDARALAVKTLLQGLMVQEEITIVNGNSSLALGTTPKPTVTPALGGLIGASATNYVFCVAMTYQAYANPNNGVAVVPSYGNLGNLQPTITRTNADSSTDTFGGGIAQISAQSDAATTTSSNGTLVCTVAAVKGAFAYAWFIGQTSGASNCVLAAITTVNKATLTVLPSTNFAANSTGLSADNSRCALDFDGLLTQSLASTGYYRSLDAGTLTADTFGGVVEINVALQHLWDYYRISPSRIMAGGQVVNDITSRVLAGTNNPGFRFNMQAGDSQGKITAGTLVTGYLNRFALGGATLLPVELHPYMPPSTILLDLDEVPYPSSNVSEAKVIKTRQEYYQLEWPLRSRKYEFGVYVDEVLACYVPFGMGVITNIANG